VVAVLVTQLFGRVTPGGAPQLVGVPHPTDDHGRGLSWSRMAAGVLEARAAVPAGSAASYEYVALGGRRGYRGDLPNAWFHALSGTLLAKPAGLDLALDGPVDAREPIQAILDTNPAAQVLVPGPQLDAVRAHLGSSDAARVHGTG
jgi:hypothetical protein